MAEYNRILVKISGEAMSGKAGNIDANSVAKVAKQLVEVAESGVEVAVVIGGGNFWRGRTSENMDRVVADQIGMLATVMNGLALADAIAEIGYPVALCSSLAVDKIVDRANSLDADELLAQGAIVVFVGGTGAPYFSTDTAAVLRACEIKADGIFCAKAVDGIYDSDPKINPKAKKYDELSYDKVIADNLKAFDLTAMAMAREYRITVVCFGKDEPDGLRRILDGEKLGTIIH